MITVKNSVTETYTGSSVTTAISGMSIKTPQREVDLKDPSNAGSCPTGTCGTASVNFNALSALNTNSNSTLWKTLVCGDDVETLSESDTKNRMETSSLWLRSTNCTAEGLASLLTVDNGKLGLDKDEITRRLNNTLNLAIGNVEGGSSESLLGMMSERMGTNPRDTIVMIGQAKQLISAAKVEDAKGFTKLLKQFTGSDELIEFLDLEAEMAIIDHLLDQAIDLGIPQAFDIILGKIEDDRDKRRAILRNIKQSAMNSELKYVDKAVELIGSDGVLQKVPDIIPLILQYYSFPVGTKSEDYDDAWSSLNNTLTSIKSDWYMTNRNGVSVGYLEPFTVASTDAIKLLKRDPSIDAMVMIGPTYPIKSKITVAKQTYKNIDLF